MCPCVPPPAFVTREIDSLTALKRVQVARESLEQARMESMGLRLKVRGTIALARSTCVTPTPRGSA